MDISKMSDSSKLVIGFNRGKPKGDERPCMIVAVKEGDALHVINQFQDDEAIELYTKLKGMGQTTTVVPDDSVVITLSKREAEVMNTLLSAEIMKLDLHYGSQKHTERQDTCYAIRDKLIKSVKEKK